MFRSAASVVRMPARRRVEASRTKTLDLTETFGVQGPKAPAVQPWGLRVAHV